MNRFSPENLRNIALLGHGASGKTSLSEALLYMTGGTKRRGQVEDGSTVSDFDPEEIKRQISLRTSLIPCEWKNHKINILDTPGYLDFLGEVVGALHSVEGAVSVLCAAAGVEVGTELSWEMAVQADLAQFVFINKMDRENANFGAAVAKLQEMFGAQLLPVQIPMGAADTFTGFVDLVAMKAYEWNGNDMEEKAVPDHMQDDVEEARALLIEAVASADDDLTMKFLEDEPLTDEEIAYGLRLAVAQRTLIPILVGSARNGIGLRHLLQALIDWMPSPADVPVEAMAGDDVVEVGPETPGLCARVFKTWADPYVGKMSIFRVYSGEVKSDNTVYNVSRERDERIGQLFFLRGKEQITTTAVGAGDIGVVAKLQDTQTNDTFTNKDKPLVVPPIEFPPPTVTVAVRPAEKGDEDKVHSGLARLAEEDLSVRIEKHPVTGETLLSGLGELHLDVVNSQLQRKFGANMTMETPRVAYKETLQASAHSEYRHRKQSGGRGQYGHVIIDIDPLPADAEEEFEFVDKVFGGAVPRQYIPAVEKGIRETLEEGVLAGFPVVGVRVTLLDGSSHSVDSSEMAFKLAASVAFKQGFMKAQPVLLEPIMNVSVRVPEAFMGDIISDLNKKRGRVLGMEPDGTQQVVKAQVPQSELFRYGIDMRSITQGRGSFTAEFSHYEQVPGNISEHVIAEANAQ